MSKRLRSKKEEEAKVVAPSHTLSSVAWDVLAISKKLSDLLDNWDLLSLFLTSKELQSIFFPKGFAPEMRVVCYQDRFPSVVPQYLRLRSFSSSTNTDCSKIEDNEQTFISQFRSLSKCRMLEKLYLEDRGWKQSISNALTKTNVLHNFMHLRTLSLKKIILFPGVARSIGTALESLTRLEVFEFSLESGHESFCVTPDRILDHDAILSSLPTTLTNLTSNLSWSNPSWMSRLLYLETLDIPLPMLDNETFVPHELRLLKKLKKLNFKITGRYNGQKLASILPNLNALEYIDLTDSDETSFVMIAAAFPSLPLIRSLSIPTEYSNLGAPSAFALAEVLPSLTSLQHLDIMGNYRMTVESIQAIIVSLPSSIRELNLSELISDTWLQTLLDRASSFTNLEMLLIQGNQLDNDCVEIAMKIAAVSKLRILNIGCSTLEDDEAELIATLLPACNSLEELILENSEIGVKGACAIASALGKCNLRKLNISECPIEDEGAFAFAKALPSWLTGQILVLQTCEITQTGKDALSRANQDLRVHISV